VPAAARGQAPVERLVPAQFMPYHNMTDGQGSVWDIDQMGRVINGTNMCFGGAFMLTINNNQFRAGNAMMTTDGRELVLQGNSFMPGLQITRRCHVDGKSTGARFTEVFTNSGTAPLQFSIQLMLQCGNGMWQNAVSDSGRINPAALDKNETGVLLYAPAQNGWTSVALGLAGPGGAVRPAIQMNGGQVIISYTLTVPPRKTAAIVYGAAQCSINDQPDAKAVAAQLKPFSESSWAQDLPADIRRAVVNFGSFGGDINFEEVGIGKVLAGLETNSGPTDILTFGGGTRLKGTAACTALSLETRFGTLKTSLDKIVAVVGARNDSGKAIVVLRDGQALTGKLNVENFVFTLNSGVQIEAAGEHLERLYMRATSGTAGAGDKPVLLQTTEGERLALAPSGKETIALASPWGHFEFPFSEVAWVSTVAEPPGHRVALHDGTRLFGYLEGGPLKFSTRTFGVQALSPAEVQAIRGLQEKETASDPSQLTASCVVLAGENVLVGRIDLPALHLVTSGQSIAVPPGLIRKFHAADSDPQVEQAAFDVELWDGSKIAGTLAEGMLRVRCDSQAGAPAVWLVPARDVVEIQVPSPSLSDATRKRIAALIGDLGSGEYAKRTAARAALLEMGALAQPQLDEVVQHTSDAEVRHSALFILRRLNKNP
jgi:hypothetical protein